MKNKKKKKFNVAMLKNILIDYIGFFENNIKEAKKKKKCKFKRCGLFADHPNCVDGGFIEAIENFFFHSFLN